MRSVLGGVAALTAASLALPAQAAAIGGPPMRAMTPAEETAHAVWSLRAALNVAALQCQFSPFLATVRNYNDLLKQHAAEFAGAYRQLERHFRRHDGGSGPRSFDSFTTRMYNSFSALDAQFSFCSMAGSIGREALAIRPGAIGDFATTAVQRVRAALVAQPDTYRQVQYIAIRVAPIKDPCLDKRGRPVRNCKL